MRYRCAIRRFLNRPGWHGRATIVAEVEDTSRLHPEELRFGREPKVFLSISDCSNECRLEFHLDSRAAERNSLYKLDTLIGSLERFRQALREEIDLLNQRRRQPPRNELDELLDEPTRQPRRRRS